MNEWVAWVNLAASGASLLGLLLTVIVYRRTRQYETRIRAVYAIPKAIERLREADRVLLDRFREGHHLEGESVSSLRSCIGTVETIASTLHDPVAKRRLADIKNQMSGLLVANVTDAQVWEFRECMLLVIDLSRSHVDTLHLPGS
jgi:hypothetical protein